MKSNMLINALHPEECRVAIVEDGVLQELEIEYPSRRQTKGNIYKGVVTRIEPSIHALFVDFGEKKHGFLPFSEVHPSCYGRDRYVEGVSEGQKPTIEKQMKPGRELLVQVVKEERDTKGAYLTTYISLAGRYLVLMPGSRKGGVSRKIEDEGEREKLKGIISQLNVPDDMGLIIRTAGMGRTKGELRKDLNRLLRVWDEIKKREKTQKAPSLIYREGDIIIRTIRDYFSPDVKEILIDDPEAYKRAREFIKIIMPRYQSRVKLHQENVPLFTKFSIEEQIESIYSSRVPLKSGGSIVVDPTEALVSIDVNSGKSRGEKGIEDTAYKTNMEAVEEIARQLRLRDLGGLIVIDFIDMRQKKHIHEVEKALRNALKRDKARIDVGRISKFGLLEMSRQRIKSSLIEKSFVPCPHCGGSGTIKSVESNTIYILRKIHESVMQDNVERVDVLLPAEIAEHLLNNKREDILKIEKDYDVKVFIKGQPGIPVNSYNLETTRKRKERKSVKPVEAEDVEATPARKGRGRRGSKGGRRKKREEPAVAEHESHSMPQRAVQGEQEMQQQAQPAAEPESDEEKERKRGLIGRIKSALTGEL